MAALNRAALAGVAGAATLTLLHEVGRRTLDDAPRMDVLGMRALARIKRRAGSGEAGPRTLHRQALAGDLLANSAYYALVGQGNPGSTWLRGATLGLLAGIGALVLPRPMGLGDPPKVESASNRALTVAYYLLGGLAAAATATALQRRR